MSNNLNLQIIEALIFAAPEPLSALKIAEIAGGITTEEVHRAVETLNTDYERTGRSFRIVKGGGGFRFVTLKELGKWVRRAVLGSARVKLSRAALETLSIIAYRQPITRAGIEAVRGVDVSGVIGLLLERKLVMVKGRAPQAGRPLQYATTNDFLRYFGIDSLDDLPRPTELGDFKAPDYGTPDIFDAEPAAQPEEPLAQPE